MALAVEQVQREQGLADTAGTDEGDQRLRIGQAAERRKIVVAPDQRLQVLGQVAAQRGGARWHGWGRRVGDGGRGVIQQLGKAVPATGNGDDGAVPEQLAQRPDVHFEVVLGHHHVGPDAVQQFVLADHAVALLDQGEQQVEGARAELDGRVIGQQLALRRLQAKAPEAAFVVAVARRGHADISGVGGLRTIKRHPRTTP